ncbi:MAG: HK97 family phage prohead protease [Clostridia bacterium]|nr:HK97 family phage prohead protease [Clostridia bacterium]
MAQTKQELERRSVIVKELRVIEDVESPGKDPVIEGYASVFDAWSQELGGDFPFMEKVVKGAFEDSIKEDDIRALFNHDPNYVLGRNMSGTLSLQEDEKGLYVRIVPPDTQWARDLLVSIKRGDINQMSFGFTVVLDNWTISSDGTDVRELLKVRLYDVSPVTFPAYTQTECSIRSMTDVYKYHVADKEKRNRIAREKDAKMLKQLKQKFQLLKE